MTYKWIDFGDGTCVTSDDPSFEAYHKQWLDDKLQRTLSAKWKMSYGVKPPETYGLKRRPAQHAEVQV